MPNLVPLVKQAIDKEVGKIAEDMVGGRVAADDYVKMQGFVRGLRKAAEIISEIESRLMGGEDEEDIQF